MQSKVIEIQKDLLLLPEEKLDEVKNFVEFILSESRVPKRKVVKLRNICANNGFEKIDIESELKSIRKEDKELQDYWLAGCKKTKIFRPLIYYNNIYA